MYRQIAIALDGSSAALTAAAFARNLRAEEYRIVHVLEAGAFGRGSRPQPEPAEERAALADQLRADVLAAMTPPGGAARDVRITVDVRTGDPVDELIVASDAADLLLMTTRGRGIAGRTLFGSVADAVARRGVRPTLILRPDHDLRYPERVVVPLDGTARAERAIPVARRLAGTLGCPIVLVHVVNQEDLADAPLLVDDPDADAERVVRDEVSVAIDRATTYLLGREQDLESDTLAVQHRVVIGDTIPALIEFADPADIVVVASRAQTGLRRLVDPSVTEQLVRHAPSPVLIVHDRTRPDPNQAAGEAGLE